MFFAALRTSSYPHVEPIKLCSSGAQTSPQSPSSPDCSQIEISLFYPLLLIGRLSGVTKLVHKNSAINMKTAARVQPECITISLYSWWMCFIAFIFLAQSSPQAPSALGLSAVAGREGWGWGRSLCYWCVAMGIWFDTACAEESHIIQFMAQNEKKKNKKLLIQLQPNNPPPPHPK